MRDSVSRWLAFSLVLGTTLAPTAWAQSGLRGIELLSTPLETKIVLKSSDALGARVISADSERIVVEVGGVDPAKTIPTDFSNADTIDQVILKPSGSNRVQMIIRGSQLGSPLVTLRRPAIASAPVKVAAPEPASIAIDQESEGIHTSKPPVTVPQTEGFAMTSMQSETTTSAPNADPLPGEPITSVQGEDQAVTDLSASESIPNNLETQPVADRKPLVESLPLEDTVELSDDTAPETWQQQALGMIQTAMEKIDAESQKLPFSRTLAMALCIALGALLIGGSIYLRIRQNRHRIFELPETRHGFSLKTWFASLAPKGRRRSNHRKNRPMGQPQQATQRPHKSERPIGLGRVNTMAQPSQVVAQRQALQQYAQQADSPHLPMNHRPKGELDRELQRSLQMRGIVEQTQTSRPAKPKPKTLPKNNAAVSAPRPASKPVQQAHLPRAGQSAFNPAEPALPANNTEVLDFLRSVADLMEQDGQTHLAKGIKKGIQTHTRK